jgi:hypothetical protein
MAYLDNCKIYPKYTQTQVSDFINAYSYNNIKIHLNKITELCLYFAYILQFRTTQCGCLTLKVILGQIHNLIYFWRFLTGLMHRTLCGDVMNSRDGEGSPFKCRGRVDGIRTLYTGNL